MNLKNKTVWTCEKRPTAKVNTRSYYRNLENSIQGNFNRSRLPMPIVVLDRLGIKQGKANRGGFWILRCPFHKNGNEKNPSLNLQQVEGYYRCHACGAKGGDILSFYMEVTGKRFIEAARALGAWEESI